LLSCSLLPLPAQAQFAQQGHPADKTAVGVVVGDPNRQGVNKREETMRLSNQANVSVRFSAAIIIGLAALAGFARSGWSQIVINTIQDLQNINSNLSGDYALGGDIDASGFNFIPIGSRPTGGDSLFTGTLDGRGHTISSLTINSSRCGGLFSALGGEVKGINLANTNVNVPDSQCGIAGGLAAYSQGTIQNSNVSGTVIGFFLGGGLVGENAGTITQSFADVSVAAAVAGGLVGQNSGGAPPFPGTIVQSYATGSVTGTGAGQISGVGGLVGHNFAVITQSYAMGNVAGASSNLVGGLVGANDDGQVTQTYATGAVSGGLGSSIGGLIGASFGTATTNYSYWDIQTSGQTESAGGTGLTTAQFQSGNLPLGFDPTVWLAPRRKYPELRWQFVFAGTPGAINCISQSISALGQQFDGLAGAAAALGYSSVVDLQKAVVGYCGG
jgi:hypothetical protein